MTSNRSLSPSTLVARLEHFLDPALLVLLRRAAALAGERGAGLYLVGGTVRDLLLEQPAGDLDLVVEGDAIALAQVLAAELGGRVVAHSTFGTATVELQEQRTENNLSTQSPGHLVTLDLVMARREVYDRPAALPRVEPASLREDLLRRDAAVNALAICLNPGRYGELIDVCDGLGDLQRRQLRVLHDQSFIDDPTRILRVVRIAARLGFSIEPHTRELIGAALAQGIFRQITPQRLLHEWLLVFHEPEPERALALLDELGVLQALHPGLRWLPLMDSYYAAARQADFPVDLPELYLTLLAYKLTPTERESFASAYHMSSHQTKLLADLTGLERALAGLRETGVRNSIVDRALHGIGEVALRAGQLVESEPVPAYIARYLDQLRSMRISVDGRFIQSLGIAPGPQIGALLAALRAAYLDGEVTTVAEQEQWVRGNIAACYNPSCSD